MLANIESEFARAITHEGLISFRIDSREGAPGRI